MKYISIFKYIIHSFMRLFKPSEMKCLKEKYNLKEYSYLNNVGIWQEPPKLYSKTAKEADKIIKAVTMPLETIYHNDRAEFCNDYVSFLSYYFKDYDSKMLYHTVSRFNGIKDKSCNILIEPDLFELSPCIFKSTCDIIMRIEGTVYSMTFEFEGKIDYEKLYNNIQEKES